MVRKEELEKRLRQMFWEGQLFTAKFDVYTPKGRQAAAKYFAEKLSGDAT